MLPKIQKIKTVIAILAISLTGIVSAGGVKAQSTFPVGIAFVKEMDYIPEVDSWEKWSDSLVAVDSGNVAEQWDTVCTFVQKKCTAAAIRALSVWAIVPMQSYKRAPSLKKVRFIPIRGLANHQKLVFEAIAGKLPTHARTVTRYLKLYLLYDRAAARIVTVTVTIRGERQE